MLFDSIRARSRMLLMSSINRSVLVRAMAWNSSRSRGPTRFPSLIRDRAPLMAVRGVRSSWETIATRLVLMSSISFSRVMSWKENTDPRSSRPAKTRLRETLNMRRTGDT
jgi:hypothetical protein